MIVSAARSFVRRISALREHVILSISKFIGFSSSPRFFCSNPEFDSHKVRPTVEYSAGRKVFSKASSICALTFAGLSFSESVHVSILSIGKPIV